MAVTVNVPADGARTSATYEWEVASYCARTVKLDFPPLFKTSKTWALDTSFIAVSRTLTFAGIVSFGKDWVWANSSVTGVFVRPIFPPASQRTAFTQNC